MENKTKVRSTVGGVVFVGCMFVGIGLGMYFNQLVVGLMIGMGVGFILMGLTWALMKS